MATIYISSTYKDLIKYREAAAKALGKIRYHVIRMEDYPARAKRTRAACEDDVADCDMYIGIFAWRYGYIPEDDNEAGQSITELEYRKAAGSKPCLIFLVRERARWPKKFRDTETGQGGGGKRIRQLRKELKDHSPAYFSSPEELALEVLAGVHQNESTKTVERVNVLDEIKESVHLGPSYLPNIQTKILKAANAEIVEISLGPTLWWTTRLHLVAALASDFTRIRQFLFLDKKRNYVTMVSPLELRRALTWHTPQLEQVYLASRSAVQLGGAAKQIAHITTMYSTQIMRVFNRKEQKIKEDVEPLMLERDLGIEPSAQELDQTRSLRHQARDILNCKTPYVALVAKHKLVSIIDRLELASKIAVQSLEEL